MPGKPDWLKKKMPDLQAMEVTYQRILSAGINTVCQQACCPNSGECFSEGIATILILGDTCTRNCGYCAVKTGVPGSLDEAEPDRVAAAVVALSLQHVVITSVTRDDLTDGGANHYAAVVRRLRRAAPWVTLELLVPDFQGDRRSLGIILRNPPEILAHNLETVPRLYRLRRGADYHRSLRLIDSAKRSAPNILTKAGLMVGLGEEEEEILAVMKDLRDVGCDIFTIGQYLRPGSGQVAVEQYIPPAQFSYYKTWAEAIGFRSVFAGPYVRSSYRAGDALKSKS